MVSKACLKFGYQDRFKVDKVTGFQYRFNHRFPNPYSFKVEKNNRKSVKSFQTTSTGPDVCYIECLNQSFKYKSAPISVPLKRLALLWLLYDSNVLCKHMCRNDTDIKI